jgi:RNA polymerase sigma factor (sigma-70 family)
MPERDPIALMPLGTDVLSSEILGINAEKLQEALDAMMSHDQCYLVLPSPEHTRNVERGEHITSLRAQIIALIGNQKLLESVQLENAQIPRDSDLYRLFVNLKKTSSTLAIENLPLIPYSFKRLPGKFNLTSEDMKDMFQEGFIGLTDAAERWNPWILSENGTMPEEPTAFSTLAIPYIIGAMKNYRYRLVAYSIGGRSGFNRYTTYQRIKRSLKQELPQDAPEIDHEIIVAALLLREKRMRKKVAHESTSDPTLQEAGDSLERLRCNSTSKKFNEIMENYRNLLRAVEAVSLDEPISIQYIDERGYVSSVTIPRAEKHDLISDPSILETTVDQKLLREKLAQTLHCLNDTEREVIMLRYGFCYGFSFTLEEIGKQIGLSKSRIEQIEAKALRKLRHPTRSKPLRALWNK